MTAHSNKFFVEDNYTSVASNYTALVTDRILLVDTNASRIIQLPLASAFTGYTLTVKDISGLADKNPISIVPNGADLIQGVNSTFKINGAYLACTFHSDGTKWNIIRSSVDYQKLQELQILNAIVFG